MLAAIFVALLALVAIALLVFGQLARIANAIEAQNAHYNVD